MLSIVQSKNALSPGISEEVIWHFFLLSFIVDLFKGSIPKNKLAVSLTYILNVVPHCLIHLPNVILEWRYFSSCLHQLCGFQMVWLVKNKNLQDSIGFHWLVDMIRLLFIFW